MTDSLVPDHTSGTSDVPDEPEASEASGRGTNATGTEATGSDGYLGVLANAGFRVVFAAEILAILGLVGTQLTLAVLIYERTGSPLLSALSFALGFAPYLLGATLLSAVADRYRPRRVLIVSQCGSAAIMALMAVPHMPVAVLLAMMLLSGTVAPLYQGTRAAALSDILPPAGFPLGRSLLRMAAQTAQITGFAFGGTLLLLVSPSTALLCSGGLLLVSALLLRLGMRDRPARVSASAGTGRASIAAESLAGVREVFRIRGLAPLLLLSWIPPMLAVAPEAIAAPYADYLDGGPLAVGLLLSAAPVGMIVGELLVGSLLRSELRTRWTIPFSLVLFVPMCAFAADPPLAAAVALLTLCGTGHAYALGLDRLLLDSIPPEARGRVLTIASAGLMVTQGIGFAAAGAAAEFAAPPAVIVGAGVCGLAVIAVLGRGLLRGTAAR